MKSNSGITITSLVIYIIGLVIIIATMSIVSGYFYKNVNKLTIQQSSQEQYSKFLAYITKDVNSNDLAFVQSGTNNQKYIILKFTSGEEHQYIYQNNNIYYLNIDNQNEKKLLLCSDVSSINVFNYSEGNINLDFNIDDENFSTSLNVNIEN